MNEIREEEKHRQGWQNEVQSQLQMIADFGIGCAFKVHPKNDEERGQGQCGQQAAVLIAFFGDFADKHNNDRGKQYFRNEVQQDALLNSQPKVGGMPLNILTDFFTNHNGG